MGENEMLGYAGHLALAGARVGWDAFLLLFSWPLDIPGGRSSPVESSSFAPTLQSLVMQHSGAAWGQPEPHLVTHPPHTLSP